MAVHFQFGVYLYCLTFLYQGMLFLISKNLFQYFPIYTEIYRANAQILCVEGFKIFSKIYFKNYLKLKIFKA